jgi:hypothetical protein
MTLTSPVFFPSSGTAAITPTSSPASTSPAASTRTKGADPVALIGAVTAQLARSADPETVFGSLATAFSAHTGTHCVVELLHGGAVRSIDAHAAADSAVTSEQPSLSPMARQLLAGDGNPVSGPDWFALAIGAAASQDPDGQVPMGAFSCRFTHRRAGHARLEPARLLLGLATDLLLSECRLARAQAQVVNLEIALGSNRDIGTAIGILMNAHLVTQEQAFGMLRTASQHSHRKLREVANEVIFTGSIGPVGRADRTPGAARLLRVVSE